MACFAGYIFWNKVKASVFRYFPLYLTFILLSEFAGRLFKELEWNEMNKLLYNYLVIPAEFIFFFRLFYMDFKDKRYKWLPVFSTLIYMFSWFIDMFYLSTKKFWFYSFSYTTGNLLLLILIFSFFVQLINSDAILKFKENMLFWISAGLLLFFLGTFPYYGLLNTLNIRYTNLCISYGYIVVTLNCLMYLMFTFSFIWGKPNTKYS